MNLRRNLLTFVMALAFIFALGFAAKTDAATVKTVDGVIKVDSETIDHDYINFKRNVGESATFSLTPLDSVGYKYQWYKNGEKISGATSNSYTINSIKNEDFEYYSCNISSDSDLTGDNLYFELENLSQGIIFLKNDGDYEAYRYINKGETATFDATAEEEGFTVSYQWKEYKQIGNKEDHNYDYVPIPGATNPTYTTPAITEFNNKEYRCEVKSTSGKKRTFYGYVNKKSQLSVKVTASQKYVLEGGSVTFTASARDSANRNVTYQWYGEDADGNVMKIPGATGTTYTASGLKVLSAKEVYQPIKYVCEVTAPAVGTDPEGTARSDRYYERDGDDYYSAVRRVTVVKAPTSYATSASSTVNDGDNVKGIRVAGATSLKLTFSGKSLNGYAEVLILENSGKGTWYRNKELSGNTITVDGDTAIIVFDRNSDVVLEKYFNEEGDTLISASDIGYEVTAVNPVYPANPAKAINAIQTPLILRKGLAKTVTVTVTPKDASRIVDGKASVKSSKSKVASVSNIKLAKSKLTFSVKGLKAGTSYVTVKVGGKTAKVKVSVQNKANPVKAIKVAKQAVSVKAGKTVKVVITTTAKSAKLPTTDAVSAGSKKTAVAAVTKIAVVKGKAVITVKGVKKGTSLLTVKAGKKAAKVKVSVK